MLRLILAILSGVVLAFGVVFATDAVVKALSGGLAMPDPNDAAAMRAYMDGLPAAALAAFAIGCGAAAGLGAAMAARFGGRGAWPGWVVAALVLAATIANFVMIPHPTWLVITASALVAVVGWAAARAFASRRQPRTSLAGA